MCVRDYLEAFRGVPENQDDLRILTEKLKKMGRTDVVKAMHLHRGALHYLGKSARSGKIDMRISLYDWCSAYKLKQLYNENKLCPIPVLPVL